ncbi:hypothetical protein D1872_323270 [compost metagenome]
MFFASLIRYFFIQNLIRCEIVLVICLIIITIVYINIGINVREVRSLQRHVEEVQTIVELMVTDVTCIIIEQIHRFIYRVSLTLFQWINFGSVVSQRIPLN